MKIDVIKKKKAKYGDSFDRIAELWSVGFGIHLNGIDVAIAMADLKRVRLEFNPNDKDSKIDLENYEWIANNYTEYKKL